jgi:hypothetical protein
MSLPCIPHLLKHFSFCVECGVDQEVHATAGQEAGATYTCSDRQPPAAKCTFAANASPILPEISWLGVESVLYFV